MFQPIYDTDSQGIEWDKANMGEIMILYRCADRIKSTIAKTWATWQWRMAYHPVMSRIKDKVNEIHRKLALFLL